MAISIGSRAPDFRLKGIDGSEYSLASFAGKQACAVIFSCNHCPYVKAWEDRMVQIQADYADKGVALIAINSNDATKYPEDSFDNMIQRAQEKNFNFPYVADESQEVARAYGAERTPEVFLLDAEGTVRYHGAIDDNYENPDAVQSQYLRDALDAVLAGQQPATAETPSVGCTIKWK
ncbi:MAG: thioredoxin family protein [Armatimonadota bacterium]